ncbi:MAG: VOC family protein [Solirubrobacterales bacterium]|nr:VOC family protein [Solirubrobacterales bacterium]
MLPAQTRVASVTLRARDVGALGALYEDLLGLAREERPGGGAAYGGLVEAVPVSPGEPMPPHAHAPGLFHTALRYPTRAGLAAALRRVTEAGIHLTGASDHGVSEALYLHDPEGNGVELYWDRPADAWPRTADGRVDMYTERLSLESLLREDEPAGDGAPDVGHVHLKVSDLPRAVAFWVGVVGFEEQAAYGDQASFVSAGGYHHHLGLNVWHSRGAAPAPATSAGLDHLTLAVPSGADVEALAERLRAAGAPAELGPGGALRTTDPDGLGLAVLAEPA